MSSQAMRGPVLVDNTRPDANGNASARGFAQVPARAERYTAEDVSNPARLAALLTKLHQNHVEASGFARAHPRAQSKTFYGFPVGTSGAKLRLAHGFNRAVLWFVVGWRGNGVTAAPALVSDELDASPETTSNTLVLRSYVAGTVDIEIWGLS